MAIFLKENINKNISVFRKIINHKCTNAKKYFMPCKILDFQIKLFISFKKFFDFSDFSKIWKSWDVTDMDGKRWFCNFVIKMAPSEEELESDGRVKN